MIVCKKCGHQNRGKPEFCDSCGAFLEFVGQETDTRTLQTIDPPDAVVSAVHEQPAAPPPPAAAAPPPAAAAPNTPGDATLSHLAAPLPPAASLPQDTEPQQARSSSLVPARPVPPMAPRAPTGMAKPSARQPQAVTPGTIHARPIPTQRTAARDTERADVRCPVCNTGNKSERHFCRMCGSSLAGAESAGGWKRRLSVDSGVESTPTTSYDALKSARDRHRKRALARRRGLIAGVLAAVALLALFIVSPFGSPVRRLARTFGEKVQLLTSNPTHVHPSAIAASSEVKGREAPLAIDGFYDTYWAPSGGNLGVGESITFTFDRPTDLIRIGLWVGVYQKGKEFDSQPRPDQVKLTFTNATGAQTGKLLRLDDEPHFQSFPIHAPGTTSAKLEIVSVNTSTSGTTPAIASVEFFKKRAT